MCFFACSEYINFQLKNTHPKFCSGYGIFATKTFQPNEFLLEYPGELISKQEGERRRISYHNDIGSYIFFVNNQW